MCSSDLDEVHRQLLGILPAGWSCLRQSEVLWFVQPPRTWDGAAVPLLEYGVELLGTRIAVTHENTDAGGFTTAKLLVRCTLIDASRAAGVGATLGELIWKVFERNRPNHWGLT